LRGLFLRYREDPTRGWFQLRRQNCRPVDQRRCLRLYRSSWTELKRVKDHWSLDQSTTKRQVATSASRSEPSISLKGLNNRQMGSSTTYFGPLANLKLCSKTRTQMMILKTRATRNSLLHPLLLKSELHADNVEPTIELWLAQRDLGLSCRPRRAIPHTCHFSLKQRKPLNRLKGANQPTATSASSSERSKKITLCSTTKPKSFTRR
jgi:hypothetical protein